MKGPLILALTCLCTSLLALSGLAHGDDPKRRVLAALESVPVHKSDYGEEPSVRSARLHYIAEAIAAHATTREEMAFILTIGSHESNWARDVCEGERLGDTGKAYGCFQSHDKDRSGGIDGQVERAIRDIRRARNYCEARGYEPISGTFSLYGTGRFCSMKFPKRMATYRRIVSEL